MAALPTPEPVRTPDPGDRRRRRSPWMWAIGLLVAGGMVASLVDLSRSREPLTRPASDAAIVDVEVMGEVTSSPVLSMADATRTLIRRVWEDHLGRRPRVDELTQFRGLLGSTMTEHEVRAVVLGSREFYVAAGGSFRRFARVLSTQIDGARPTRARLRELRAIHDGADGTRIVRRRVVAAHALRDAAYDGDDLQANRLIIRRAEDGVIQRISVRVNRPVHPGAVLMTVSIRGERVTGRIEVSPLGRLVSLIPDSELRKSGMVVATVVTADGDGTAHADRSRTIEPIFDSIFPDVRVVAFYGNHQTRLMGVLGETGPEPAVARVKAAAAPFSEPGRPAVGAFEMIATVAQAAPGADGDYSEPSRIEDLRPWIDVARREGLYVILDIQPGRSDFFTESIRYRELLLEPHVGLALDPEWRMTETQRPGQVVGQVSAAEVNQVSKWLSDLVVENDLPEKLFILHQFQTRMITNREDLIARPGLATIIHADGFGGRAIKLQTYSLISTRDPFWNGFKLFIDEDTAMFRPNEVLGFSTVPVPDLVTYQ